MKIKLVIIIILFYILLVVNNYNIFRYIFINYFPFSYCNPKKYQLISRVQKKERVIVTFTTVPGRINKVRYTIASILNQTVRVDEICIYVPYKSSKGNEYIIPEWMEELERKLLQFKIKRCNRDWGPATKIIPALLEFENMDCTIIYIDDDIIYNKNMLETLISYNKIYPGYAICNQGWDVERWNGKSSLFSRTLHHAAKYIPNVDPYNHVFTDVLQGFSGVLVKPQFFDMKKLVNFDEYPQEVFFVDDVYLSGHLNDQGIHRISTLIQSGLPYFEEFIQGFLLRNASYSLSSEHNNDLINDRIACTCFKWMKQVRISFK
jgi:hypothetical protein